MRIQVDHLASPQVRALIQTHLHGMSLLSPPESIHALGVETLRQPDVTFWTAWEGDTLLGCGAVKELTPDHGEVKSMRTDPAHLRKGVGAAILQHIIESANSRGYQRLSLETGTHERFQPAHQLYLKYGFRFCGPFGDYAEDPHSTFMTKTL